MESRAVVAAAGPRRQPPSERTRSAATQVPHDGGSGRPTVSAAAVGLRWGAIVVAFTLAAAGIAGGFIGRNTSDPPRGAREEGKHEAPAAPESAFIDGSPDPVASPGRGSLVRIDATTGEIIARVPSPRPMLVAADGRSVWVLSEGIWGADALVHVDAETNSITGISDAVVLGAAPTQLAAVGGNAWLGSERGELYRFAPGAITGEQARFTVNGWDLRWPVAAAGSLWVACCGPPPTLLRVDPITGRILARIDRVEQVVASGPGFVWAIARLPEGAGGLVRVDSETHSRVPIGTLGFRWADLTVADGAVWASSPDDGTIVRLDPVTGLQAQRIRVGGEPAALTSGAGAVWTAIGGGAVARYDIAAARISTIDVGGPAIDLVFAHGSVWVAVRR
jgi:streptogramin lyase